MKKNYFLFLLLFPLALFARQEEAKPKMREVILAARGGYHIGLMHTYELGGYLAITHGEGADGPRGWFGPFLSYERSVYKRPENNGRVIPGWRAGFEYNMAFPWGFRCSVAGYNAMGKQALRLCPEAGLSIYCGHLYVGYNIPLSHSQLVPAGFQISLLLGVPVYFHEINHPVRKALNP